MKKDKTPQDDNVGPMLGWSLGTGMDKKEIKDLLDLPCVYTFKVVGDATLTFEEDLKADVEGRLGRTLEAKECSTRTSTAGKYISISFHLHVTTIEEIYDIYALLKANKGTRFLL